MFLYVVSLTIIWQIEWFKDGQKLTAGKLAKINIIHVTEYSVTLAFESVQPEHRGNYSCVASNTAMPGLSSSHSANMIIHGKSYHLTLFRRQLNLRIIHQISSRHPVFLKLNHFETDCFQHCIEYSIVKAIEQSVHI